MKIASYTTFYKDLRTGGLEYALQHSAALGFDAIEVIHAKRGDPPLPLRCGRHARALMLTGCRSFATLPSPIFLPVRGSRPRC